jgi:hypothetical protein
METNTTNISQNTPAVLKLGLSLKKGTTSKSLLPKTAYYAAKISEEYSRAKESAATIGRLLIEAKASLPHGEWGKLTGETTKTGIGLLPFSSRAAQMFMAIARDKKLGNPNHGSDLPLPLSWRTQYELTKLTDEQWERGVREGIINPQMERKDVNALRDEPAHVAYNSGENEWYTPASIISLAREVMGDIDLDPASSSTANEVVGANRFYDVHDNGLSKPWAGRVWLNPPYHHPLITHFTKKLTMHVLAGDVREAIALVNNATETGWFQDMLHVARGVCFPKGRIRFWQPGEAAGEPLQGQACLYFGERFRRFAAVFSRIGCTLPRKLDH